MSPRIRDVWKHVRSAIEQPAGPRREKGGEKGVLDQIAKDVQKTLQIVEKGGPKLVPNWSYAEAAKGASHSSSREVIVLLKQRREIIVNAAGETLD
jgi:hypothetical protein